MRSIVEGDEAPRSAGPCHSLAIRAIYPSTTLRVVPIPTFYGEDHFALT